MTTHVTLAHLEHLAWVSGAEVEFDNAQGLAVLSLGVWTYVATLAPVETEGCAS